MAQHEFRGNYPLPDVLPGEKIQTIQPTSNYESDHRNSSTAEILQLTRSTSLSEVGKNGPSIASLPLPEHMSDEEYRKYEALFGRDSLRVADTLMEWFPELARTTLLSLAGAQGVSYHAGREEEPGRIAHEIRDPNVDLLARKLSQERGWEWPYYGSVDATPQFIRVLTRYVREVDGGEDLLSEEFTGRDGKTHTMLDALNAAVDWTLNRLNANEEGLLEFKRSNPGGIENQVWRDSWDAFHHADGTIANHDQGIASTEVQRGAMDALFDAADMYQEYRLASGRDIAGLRSRAMQLRDTILETFWTEDKGGYFVLGTDRDEHGTLRQLKVRTSDMGHLLHSRLLDGNDPDIVRKREAIIQQLFSEEMLCLNGIRTLASDEVRFRPGAYHNGSVWPWQNYLISKGLERHGYYGLAHYLNQLLIDDFIATKRSPEYLRGDSDPNYRINMQTVVVYDAINQQNNTIEQPPQDIQAWSTAAQYAIKRHRDVLLHMLRTEREPELEKLILVRLAASKIVEKAAQSEHLSGFVHIQL